MSTIADRFDTPRLRAYRASCPPENGEPSLMPLREALNIGERVAVVLLISENGHGDGSVWPADLAAFLASDPDMDQAVDVDFWKPGDWGWKPDMGGNNESAGR